MSDDIRKELEARTPPKQSLEFRMDPDSRMAIAVLSTEREKFAIAPPPPVEIPIPFHVLKEAVAQILTVEVELALAKLPGGNKTPRNRWPQGMQGVMRVAEMLMDASQLEAAGAAITEENDPHFKPRLEQIL